VTDTTHKSTGQNQVAKKTQRTIKKTRSGMHKKKKNKKKKHQGEKGGNRGKEGKYLMRGSLDCGNSFCDGKREYKG